MLLCACLEALARIGVPDSIDAVRTRLGNVFELPAYLLPSWLNLIGSAGQLEDGAGIAALLQRPGLQAPVLNALTSLRNRHPALTLPADLLEPLKRIAGAGETPLLGYHAVRLLAALPTLEDVIGFLEQCLDHPDKTIRIGAAQSIRESGSKDADSILRRRLAAETDEEVLQAAGLRGIE
jgi:hypothetical protein